MKYIMQRFEGSQINPLTQCACCRGRLVYGFQLNTGEIIDADCYTILRILEQCGCVRINERTARDLRISRHEVEFFGLTYVENDRKMAWTAEELQRIDEQAMKDEKDLFG